MLSKVYRLVLPPVKQFIGLDAARRLNPFIDPPITHQIPLRIFKKTSPYWISPLDLPQKWLKISANVD